jgi:hypothetical protein
LEALLAFVICTLADAFPVYSFLSQPFVPGYILDGMENVFEEVSHFSKVGLKCLGFLLVFGFCVCHQETLVLEQVFQGTSLKCPSWTGVLCAFAFVPREAGGCSGGVEDAFEHGNRRRNTVKGQVLGSDECFDCGHKFREVIIDDREQSMLLSSSVEQVSEGEYVRA